MAGQIALSVSIFVSALLLLIPMGFLGWKIYQLHQEMVKAIPWLSGLGEAAKTQQQITDLFIKYQEGTTRVAEAQVAAITKLEESVNNFKGLMFAGDSHNGVVYPDEEKASEEWEIQEIMRHGITRDDAEARIRQNKIYSNFKLG